MSELQAHNQARNQGVRSSPRKFVAPSGKICWTYFESIEHSLENLGHSQKTLRPPLVSQAGYGPAHNCMLPKQ